MGACPLVRDVLEVGNTAKAMNYACRGPGMTTADARLLDTMHYQRAYL